MAKKRRKLRRRNGAARRTEHHVLVGLAPRKLSDFEKKARNVLIAVLDVAEKNPERAIEGVTKIAGAAQETIRFVRENPKAAKKLAAEGALALLAGFAKKELQAKR